MSNFQQQNEKILTACKTGDQQTLQALFSELDIGPNQPRNMWNFDGSLEADQHTPPVNDMLHAAIRGEQIDMVNFLSSTFPKLNMNSGPLVWAIDTGNVELVEAICKIHPAAANGAYQHMNNLAYACFEPKNAEIVRVLLQYGADPNKPAEHTPPFSNVSYAVAGGMPLSTFEQFFDHGYLFNDGWAVRRAIECKRADVLEVLFARGGQLPTVALDSKEALIKLALEQDKSSEMVDVIERGYPEFPKKKKGLVNMIVGKLRS
ncbi:hypothetical protein M406DRAFT_329286 [Cryphonectria parasitica EP155]|uniref:Ankyrin repeat domain-containing protein n=1 Tax=Cryphonectria parasitica (strain ATCC 38755 / EP155) TaxID=660469 RepID=A0A9P4Y2I2_CRYP1|nr:uncharacterized protein M406DRAFT_329286 [Cryphonectria parasitica EP155]KAF3765371.1 hypothetical protein M406DRAFT_329286 [Cryphonectria parasitica EP155]